MTYCLSIKFSYLEGGLLEFISEYINEQWLTRMQTSLKEASAAISKQVNRIVIPACEQMVIALHRLQILTGDQKLNCLGLDEAKLLQSLDFISGFLKQTISFQQHVCILTNSLYIQIADSQVNFEAFFHFVYESVASIYSFFVVIKLEYGEAVLAAKRQAQLTGDRIERRPFRQLEHKKILSCLKTDLFGVC